MKSPEKNHHIITNIVDFRPLPNEIREETDDRITIVENIPAWEKILIILIGFFLLLFVVGSYYDSKVHPNNVHVALALFYAILIFFLAIGIYMIFCSIRWLLINYSVTIDKKSERIIIKKDSKISFLKSIKEMSFSGINWIEIKEHIYGGEDDTYTWRVNLIKFQGGSTKIYETYYKSDAEILAEKLSRITNKRISLRSSLW